MFIWNILEVCGLFITLQRIACNPLVPLQQKSSRARVLILQTTRMGVTLRIDVVRKASEIFDAKSTALVLLTKFYFSQTLKPNWKKRHSLISLVKIYVHLNDIHVKYQNQFIPIGILKMSFIHRRFLGWNSK